MKKTSNTSATTVCALYLRYSTDEQGDQTFSTIDAQREFLTAYATEKGYTVAAEYSDPGRTGTNLKRPGFKALLQSARAGEINAVLVTFMDRLGRGKTYTIAEYELGQAGARVITARQSFGGGTAGYIGQSARQMVDGIYPELVREWTASKMIAMLAQGYHCAGRAPYGYRSTAIDGDFPEGKNPPKRLVPDPDEAAIILQAYRMAADGDGKAAVRRYLSDASGQVWNFDRVTRALCGRTYRGVATWGPDHINEAAHLPIVDEGLWQSAQEGLEESGRLMRGVSATASGKESSIPYYFRGMVRCVSCGHSMTPYWTRGRTGKMYRYYQCIGKRNGGGVRCSGAAQVSADKLHQTVMVEAAAMARVPWRLRGVLSEARAALPSLTDAKRDAGRSARESGRLTRERDRLVAVIRMGAPASVLPTLTREIITLESQIRQAEALQREAETAAASVSAVPTPERCTEVLSRLGELWAAATETERCLIAARLVARVDIRSADEITAHYYLAGDNAAGSLRDSRGGVREMTEEKGRWPVPARNHSHSNTPLLIPGPAVLSLPLTMVKRIKHAGTTHP